jgi:hemoglobin/transferrin/lactoferrin receptor protein
MGKRAQTLDTVWGLRRFYVERMNNKDTLVRNNDPYVQVGSAYSQYDILQKIRYQPRENAFHTLNFQFSNSSNIPRYDRLTDPNTRTVLNYAEWYYGPQKRLMAAYDGRILDLKGFFQSLNLNANYQNIGESRYTRAFDNNFLTGRVEKVQVWGANFGLRRVRDRHDLRIGTDFQFSEVDSKASCRHVVVDTVGKASTRYPDGGNTMLTYAAYATHTWKLSDKWTLNDGLRLQNVSIKSRFIDKTFFPFPFSDYKQNNFGWSGNIGLIYNPSSQTKVSLMGTTGFRVPNVDDLGKVFDSQRGSVIVPNPNIKPEKTYSAELGFTTGFTGRFTFENALYMTRFRNAIITDIFTFNGQDSIVYDGVKSRVLANQNKRIATLWGFSSHFKAKITEGVLLTGSINYTKGRINNADGKTLPLDHVPPLYGRLGIQYFTKRFNTELYSNFNGWKRLDDYLLNGEDNEVYATKEGMPSWWTINFKMGYTFKNITLQAGVENIMDINYRVFASGIHAAGRNIYTTLRFGF